MTSTLGAERDMTIVERLDHLASLLPAPDNPLHAGTSDEWAALTDRMALLLPIGYQYFVRRYGAGSIGVNGDEHPIINILTPFDSIAVGNLISQIPPILRDISDLKAEFPDDRPFPLLYEPGGFVPWGWSCDGDIYGWLTEGSPGAWRTTVVPRHSDWYAEPVDFLSFITGIVDRTRETEGIPLTEPGQSFRWLHHSQKNT